MSDRRVPRVAVRVGVVNPTSRRRESSKRSLARGLPYSLGVRPPRHRRPVSRGVAPRGVRPPVAGGGAGGGGAGSRHVRGTPRPGGAPCAPAHAASARAPDARTPVRQPFGRPFAPSGPLRRTRRPNRGGGSRWDDARWYLPRPVHERRERVLPRPRRPLHRRRSLRGVEPAGVVRTLVELSDSPAPTTETLHYSTGVDPDPGAEPENVERAFYLFGSGTELMLVLVSTLVVVARLPENRQPTEERA